MTKKSKKVVLPIIKVRSAEDLVKIPRGPTVIVDVVDVGTTLSTNMDRVEVLLHKREESIRKAQAWFYDLEGKLGQEKMFCPMI